ncbi:MAG: hypothetical protein A3J79_13115 [Elusimicrobia bacterium RIFOXYB2_FULL_62_6]|nr:MAG: hypothetical protein A3J79_13115 [Elusimicrobia bacterium RIFOXYB2_FULL_62_6]
MAATGEGVKQGQAHLQGLFAPQQTCQHRHSAFGQGAGQQAPGLQAEVLGFGGAQLEDEPVREVLQEAVEQLLQVPAVDPVEQGGVRVQQDFMAADAVEAAASFFGKAQVGVFHTHKYVCGP